MKTSSRTTVFGEHLARFRLPPMRGGGKDGRGEFYDSGMYDGVAVFVRFIRMVNPLDSYYWEHHSLPRAAQPGRRTSSGI